MVRHSLEYSLTGLGRLARFGTGQEISGGVVHQDVERTIVPKGLDHLFHAWQIANVAGERSNLAGRHAAQFDFRLGWNLPAAAADVNRGAQFQMHKDD
jgi:hypothetical protein